jgi:hypothetical protein
MGLPAVGAPALCRESPRQEINGPFFTSAIVLSQEKQLRSSYGIKAVLLQRDLQM